MKLPALLRIGEKDILYPLLCLLLTAFAALGLAVYFYFTGPDQAVPWQTVPDLQEVTLPADRFEQLLQPFDLRVRGFLITERFDVGRPVISTTAAAIVSVLVALAVAFFLTVISTFRQLPFFAGVLLWMLLLATLNLDLLGIFPGTRQYLLMATLLLTGGTALAFQAFFTNVSFRFRLLVFLLEFAGIGLFLVQASPLTPGHLALHLANYGATGCFVAAALFVFWVAYENIHGLLWFNTQSQHPHRRFSRLQFLLITALYLLNLGLLYLENTRMMDVEVVLLNAFLILGCSALVGFWGTKRREHQYLHFFTFERGAAFLYLAFGTITAASIGYAFATANDALVRAYSDLIVFSHLAFGAMFFLYILINFGGLLGQRLRVFMVVYDPKIFPFLPVLIMGTILFASLLIRANYMLPRKVMAGLYNLQADFYKATGDQLLAERFYQEADTYLNNNVKSALSLADLYQEKAYLQSEIKQLKKATDAYATDKAFIRLANMYPDQGQLFDQLFVLQRGVKQFPNSAPINNNLGLLYAATGLSDSAGFFLDRAQDLISQPAIVHTNRLAFYLRSGQSDEAAKLAASMGDQTHVPLQSNLLLLQSQHQEKLLNNPVELPVTRVLSPDQFALVYHSALQGQAVSDKRALQQLNRYLADESNQQYRFDLSVAKAFVQQRLGQAMAARTTLENLAATESDFAGYLLDLIGLQLLQEKLYGAAAAHFAQARARGWQDAGYHLLVALAFQPDKQLEALLEAEQLKSAPDKALAKEAAQLAFLLQAPPAQIVTQANDSLKVRYLQLNQQPGLMTEEEFLAIASTVKAPELRKIAQKELATAYVNQRKWAAAATVIQALLPQLDQQNQLLSEVNLLQAHILLETDQDQSLRQALSRMYLSPADQKKKYYFLAQLAQQQNQPAAAKKYYDLALQAMPAHTPTVLAAASFYRQKLKQENRAYDLLLNSITYNPHDPAIYKAYILQSVSVGYSAFAESALEDLARLIKPNEMEAFRQEYAAQQARRRAALALPQ